MTGHKRAQTPRSNIGDPKRPLGNLDTLRGKESTHAVHGREKITQLEISILCLSPKDATSSIDKYRVPLRAISAKRDDKVISFSFYV